jgi:hypothetical protein
LVRIFVTVNKIIKTKNERGGDYKRCGENGSTYKVFVGKFQGKKAVKG